MEFCQKTNTGLKGCYDLLRSCNAYCMEYLLRKPSFSARKSRLNGGKSSELLSPLSCCIGHLVDTLLYEFTFFNSLKAVTKVQIEFYRKQVFFFRGRRTLVNSVLLPAL